MFDYSKLPKSLVDELAGSQGDFVVRSRRLWSSFIPAGVFLVLWAAAAGAALGFALASADVLTVFSSSNPVPTIILGAGFFALAGLGLFYLFVRHARWQGYFVGKRDHLIVYKGGKVIRMPWRDFSEVRLESEGGGPASVALELKDGLLLMEHEDGSQERIPMTMRILNISNAESVFSACKKRLAESREAESLV